MADYLGPNAVAPRTGGATVGGIAWSGTVGATLGGFSFLAVSAGTLTNTAPVARQVAVQAALADGGLSGSPMQRWLAPGQTWTLAAPPTGGGWVVLVENAPSVVLLSDGLVALSLIGAVATIYGGYAIGRDLRNRARRRKQARG